MWKISKELKEKQQQYGHVQYKNIPKDEKRKLVEYRNNYYKVRRNALLWLQETISLKNNDLKEIFEEAILKLDIKMFQKINFEAIKAINQFKQEFTLNNWFKLKKVEIYRSQKLLKT